MRVCEIKEGFFLDDTSILREKTVYSGRQEQTKDTFSFKWKKYDSYNGKTMNSDYRKWLREKYFSNDDAILNKVFFDGSIVLDAGCGAGMSAIDLLGKEKLKKIYYIGVDISEAVDEAKKNMEIIGCIENNEFVQCDLNNIPIKEKVDVIFSEGVLHHTDSTRDAIINLSKRIKQGGFFCFYVYAKKAPIREFTDDYIREYYKDKSNEETWEGLKNLTEFGKLLGDLDITLNIKKDIPFLGIKSGKINLQRFFYWYLFKCYYRPDYSLEEMNHINFDWYRPQNCHRQTPDEVTSWCKEAGLKIERINVEEAGITVVALKE